MVLSVLTVIDIKSHSLIDGDMSQRSCITCQSKAFI
uniref:Uncharacterized protein n=1 Tax=Arundo donax TaxID=35708 RepID=A0A0A9D576_ARUDO